MTTFSNTNNPAYIWDAFNQQWVPIGTGPHTHGTGDVPGVIPNTTVTAAGDMIVATGAGVVTRQGIGSNNTILHVDNTQPTGMAWVTPGTALVTGGSTNDGTIPVASSTATTGIAWQTYMAAGKNFILNGACDWWQRGTSFSSGSPTGGWTADRIWVQDYTSVSRSTDVPSGQGFAYSINIANTGFNYPRADIYIPAEEAVFIAGKTVTFSVWAKNISGNASLYFEQQVPTSVNGFNGSVTNLGGTTLAAAGSFSGSWQRYSYTFVVSSTAATNGLILHPVRDATTASSTNYTGFQLEVGTQATSFSRAGGAYGTDLLLCQRYYHRHTSSGGLYTNFGWGQGAGTGSAWIQVQHPVPMRATPSSIDIPTSYSGITLYGNSNNVAPTFYPVTSVVFDIADAEISSLNVGVSGGGITPSAFYRMINQSSTAWYLGFSAEVR